MYLNPSPNAMNTTREKVSSKGHFEHMQYRPIKAPCIDFVLPDLQVGLRTHEIFSFHPGTQLMPSLLGSTPIR